MDADISGPFLKEIDTEGGVSAIHDSYSFPSLRAIVLIWYGPPPSKAEETMETVLDRLVADISGALSDRDGNALDEFKLVSTVPLDNEEKEKVGHSVLEKLDNSIARRVGAWDVDREILHPQR